MHSTGFIAATFVLLQALDGQVPTYGIRQFAGAPRQLGDGGRATAALLWSPRGVSIDRAGNLYIADTGNARIRKVTADGVISTIAGSTPGTSADPGTATSALLLSPSRAIAATNGDLYIADSANNRLRKVSSTGAIATVAGTGTPGFSGDSAQAVSAQLSFPSDTAVDANGNIYIADTNNMRVRRITPQGVITTVAGTGAFGYSGDGGPASRAALGGPRGVAIDAGGTLYVADTLNHRIRKIAPDGTITTIAGGNRSGFSGDGSASEFALLDTPTSVAVDGTGNLYVADSGNHRIRRVSPQGMISTISGGATNGFRGDNGPAAFALLNSPESVATDAAGNLYVADTGNHRIRRIDTQGVIATVAGSDPAAGDNSAAAGARLLMPSGLAFGSSGDIYIADSANHRIRRVSAQGMITTFAGTGAAGYSGDNGPAIAAQLNNPTGLAIDAGGDLYIADTGNHVVRRVTQQGAISTVAGTGQYGHTGDTGPANGALLFHPSAVAIDQNGVLYIADSGNNRIRTVARGMIRNFAGDADGLPGFAGDNGPAVTARFDYPISLAIDTNGDVYVSDYFNSRIRRITPGTGIIATVAGSGTRGFAGDGGPATQAQLYLPAGIAFDGQRNLLVADFLGNRVRMIARNGIIASIAGNGAAGDSGDGASALSATLAGPRDLATDPSGAIYVSDQDNHRVRKLAPSTISIRSIVNSASLINSAVAPGEAVTIWGTDLGGSVTFDGAAARVLYSSATQVNVIVPAAVAGRSSTAVRVSNSSGEGDTFVAEVREAAPGIFTLNGSGTGAAAVLNQDSTTNTAANPARPGSIVSIYATGQGTLTNPTVRIQGLAADVLYFGETAPGLYQINARVPSTAFISERSPVEVTLGAYSAQPGVTIAIR